MLFSPGEQVFIKEEQFENDEFDYSVDPVEGLDEAKWAANFNGLTSTCGIITRQV